jgi:hypothetical protein
MDGPARAMKSIATHGFGIVWQRIVWRRDGYVALCFVRLWHRRVQLGGGIVLLRVVLHCYGHVE